MKTVYTFKRPNRWEACFTGDPLPPPSGTRWPDHLTHHYYTRFEYDQFMSPQEYIQLHESYRL